MQPHRARVSGSSHLVQNKKRKGCKFCGAQGLAVLQRHETILLRWANRHRSYRLWVDVFLAFQHMKESHELTKPNVAARRRGNPHRRTVRKNA